SMRDFNHALDVALDSLMIARPQGADVEYHVNLLGADAQCCVRFGDFAFGAGSAERESYDSTNLHRRAGQLGRDQRYPKRIYAYAGKLILPGFAADLQDFFTSGIGTK